jgi:hypothetical protein
MPEDYNNKYNKQEEKMLTGIYDVLAVSWHYQPDS